MKVSDGSHKEDYRRERKKYKSRKIKECGYYLFLKKRTA
jgi:hypothetical protein